MSGRDQFVLSTFIMKFRGITDLKILKKDEGDWFFVGGCLCVFFEKFLEVREARKIKIKKIASIFIIFK